MIEELIRNPLGTMPLSLSSGFMLLNPALLLRGIVIL
jgi:hypothetical protein